MSDSEFTKTETEPGEPWFKPKEGRCLETQGPWQCQLGVNHAWLEHLYSDEQVTLRWTVADREGLLDIPELDEPDTVPAGYVLERWHQLPGFPRDAAPLDMPKTVEVFPVTGGRRAGKQDALEKMVAARERAIEEGQK